MKNKDYIFNISIIISFITSVLILLIFISLPNPLLMCFALLLIIITVISFISSIISFITIKNKTRKQILKASVLMILILTTYISYPFIIYYKINQKDVDYTYKVSLIPDYTGHYSVNIPLPLDSNEKPSDIINENEMIINSTDHGLSYLIEDNTTFMISKSGKTRDFFDQISMSVVDFRNFYHFDEGYFWIYCNLSQPITSLDIEIIYKTASNGGQMDCRINGTIFNGWNEVYGKNDGWVE